MNVKEIRINAQLMCNKSIDKSMCINYINEGIRDIISKGINAGEVKKRELFAFNTKWYPIKAKDEINRVLLKLKYIINEQNKRTKMYIKVGDEVMFDLMGRYTLFYVLLPNKVKSEDDEPGMKECYHDALSAYCAYRERLRFYGADDDSTKLLYELYNQRIFSTDGGYY
ncbi:hypothetical protein ANASTE_00540 [Anaerofustis stercorihominis DSM 17244]|uniref:Uncharacterized protein n=1 Tax=Anaerofustis stercorihominis DSM 17244 TaxID=445971 RepID=B1C742_9FIRM|nr:hypothetical protein [Anaerofustis stercorihominis]EDS72829.1 hypothetical protein ANASTE_00540 [Anaerofustis stercorihominis DSM 17244]